MHIEKEVNTGSVPHHVNTLTGWGTDPACACFMLEFLIHFSRRGKGRLLMGGSLDKKEEQLKYLNMRMDLIATYIEELDPEQAGVEELDRIIDLLDHLESKCKVFRNSWTENGEE